MSPYRKPEEMPFYKDVVVPPLSERHPLRFKLVQFFTHWFVGAFLVPILGAAGWLLFPGLYYFGNWVTNDVLGWGWKDIHDGPQRWFAGLVCVGIVAVVLFASAPLGKNIVESIKKKARKE